MWPLPSPRRAEFMRRGAGLLAEEAGEVGRIGKGEVVGDFVDRLAGEHELTLGFGEHALADQVAGGDAGCSPDMVVEAVDRHRQPVGVEGELPLLVEIFFDELAQRLDGRAGRLERNRLDAGTGTAGREPVGTIGRAKVREIAEIKMKDLNANDMDAAMRMIEGAARSMGVDVKD